MIWDFNTISGQENRFYLNQFELTLTFDLATPLPHVVLYAGVWYKNQLNFDISRKAPWIAGQSKNLRGIEL